MVSTYGCCHITDIPSTGRGAGSRQRQRRKEDGLLGYEDEHHAGRAVVLHRMGVHDRSCRDHRSDEVEVRP